MSTAYEKKVQKMHCFCKESEKRNKIAACTVPQATCNRKCARVFEQGSEEFSLYPCAPHRTWVTPSLKSVSQLATHTLDQFQRYKQTEKSWPIELGSLKQTVLVSAFYSRSCTRRLENRQVYGNVKKPQ